MANLTTYVIATSPRTGSTLLCEALTATKVLGNPTERFDPGANQSFLLNVGTYSETPFEEYFAAVLRRGTTKNGVFGVKVHWSQVEFLAQQSGAGFPEVFDRLFPGAKYINLTRRDRRGQAISFYRLEQGNRRTKLGGLEFDAKEIRRLEGDLYRQQLGWAEYFRARGIEPLTIEYESLVRYRRHEVARVLAFLGEDPAIAEGIPEPQLVQQADETTIAWRRLLDAEDAPAATVRKRRR